MEKFMSLVAFLRSNLILIFIIMFKSMILRWIHGGHYKPLVILPYVIKLRPVLSMVKFTSSVVNIIIIMALMKFLRQLMYLILQRMFGARQLQQEDMHRVVGIRRVWSMGRFT